MIVFSVNICLLTIFTAFYAAGRINGASLFPDKLPVQGQGWCGHPCDNNKQFTEDELWTSCGNSQTCRFDACATGDLSIASVTRAIESDFKNKTDILGKTEELLGLCCLMSALS